MTRTRKTTMTAAAHHANYAAIQDLADDLDNLATDVARTSADHGPRHWRDVARVGLALWAEGAEIKDKDMVIVLLFAMLHDSQRLNEFEDPEHGERAARLAGRLGDSGALLDWLDGDRALQLQAALARHDKGEVADEYDNAAVATCWDADRLTLWRVGKEPDPQFLSTAVAKQPQNIAMTQVLVRNDEDRTWADIVDAYAALRPLDIFNPAVPPQIGREYRNARRKYGDDLHPELARCLGVADAAGDLPMIGHRFIHDIYLPGMTAHYNARYLVKKQRAEEAWEANDFTTYIYMHEKPYRLDALIECVDFLPPEKLADLAGSIWVHSENIHQQEREWKAVWKGARDGGYVHHCMDEDEQRAFEALPDEITVYRGYWRPGREHGMSWTLSEEKARWFARRFAGDEHEPMVAVGTVKKDDVLAFFDGRGEDEIVALPEDVEVEDIYEVSARD